jgi:hypothetical protein
MIAEKLTDDLQLLIEKIHEARDARNQRRAELLNEEPSQAGLNELEGMNKHGAALRLAEDILRDAIKELRAIAGDGSGGATGRKAG